MRPSLRLWVAIGTSALALAGLTGALHLASGPPRQPTGADVVTYEISGPAGTTATVRYGDVVGQLFNPWAATVVDGASLPWRTTTPLVVPLAMHDLEAVGAPQATLTCTVRHNGRVVSTWTDTGVVDCDTTPG